MANGVDESKNLRLGPGTIIYIFNLSQCGNRIEFFFRANPVGKKDDQPEKESFIFERDVICTKESIILAVTELQTQFLEKFPEPEHFFSVHIRLSDRDFIFGRSRVSPGVDMTKEYLDKVLFKNIKKTMNQGLMNIQKNKNISMMILEGFIAVVGIVAVAMAFTALNALTFGVPGLVLAGIGATLALTGVGLFAKTAYKNSQIPNEILDFSQSLTASTSA